MNLDPPTLGSPATDLYVVPRAACGPVRRGGPRRRRRRPRDDAGSEPVEVVLVLPALLMLLALAFQFAMWALAAHGLALGVAEGGAEARAALGNGTAAVTTVRSVVENLAGGLLVHPTVQLRQLDHQYAEITAAGEVPSLIPGIHLSVVAISAGPVQEFRPSG